MEPSTSSAARPLQDAPPPPPPTPATSHHRRPRVREVSSRFMSPVVSTVQRRRQQMDGDSSRSSDENNKPIENSETTTSFPIGYSSSSQCKPNPGTTTNTTSQRRQRAVKLFKEHNGDGNIADKVPPPPPHPSKSCNGRIGFGTGSGLATPCGGSRPDTPTITVHSRYMLSHQKRSASVNCNGNGNSSAAAKLLQASGMSLASKSFSNQLKGSQLETSSVCSDTSSVCSDDDCADSGVNCSVQSLPELGSKGDKLNSIVSTSRSVAEKSGYRGVLSSGSSSSISNNSSSGSGGGDLKFHAGTPLHRSISLPPSGNEHKQASSSFPKTLSLPPVPPCTKPAVDARKGKKGSSHQEDVHSLRLLYNRYLQWRYANARAESVMEAQQRECEKVLYSHAIKIAEMRDSVNRKRIELDLLRRFKTLSTILEAQIPYLEEWSVLEKDYSVSITEVIQALLNALVQLPTGGNIRVDAKEVEEALNSALKMMETIDLHIQRFVPKAEEIEVTISELARLVGGARALIGECGHLLSKTSKAEVEECSLRGQLIQLHSICDKKNNVSRS